MPGKRYTIELITEKREQLNRLIRGGKHAAPSVPRARTLMKIDEGWTVPQIAAALDVPEAAVDGVKRRYADKGSEGCVTVRWNLLLSDNS